LSISMAGIRPVKIVMSLASIDMTFTEWTWTTVVTWDFLMLPSIITAVLLEDIWDVLKVWLKLWRY